MKNILRILLLAVFWCTNFKYAHAQLVSGDVFLKGNFVEVGIGPNGAFGSANNAPAGYHPRSSPSTALGFVADPDKDGWGTGTPTYVGDFFMPGTPQEGWDVQVNGTRANAWRGLGTGFSSASLTGSNTSYTVSGKKKRGVFQATMGNLSITQTTTLDTEKLFFVVNVKLKNTGSSTLLNVFYNRTVDPDNAVMLTGSYVTNNVIAKQAASSADNSVLVEANASSGTKNIYLGLGTKDCRAKCYIVNSGLLASASVTDIWSNSGTAASYIQNVGGTKNDDVGIGLLFNIGNIAAGDSTLLSYTYILRQADLDSAMEEIQPKWLYGTTELKSKDTIKGCVGDVLPVSIINGDGLSWGTWTSLVGLSSTSGRTNNITVQTTATTYRVIGTAASCNADTMFIVVAPDAPPSAPTVTSPINLCVGGPGATLTATGTNLKWYTVASGGTALASAPVISTASASAATYYVSQTSVARVGGCEGSRSAITVHVNALPSAPIVTSPVNLCVGGPGTTLTATGSNLKWYTSASGGTALASAPTITTGSASSTIFYVSQTSDASVGACEGTRSAITVNVSAPAAPGVISPVNLCVGGPGTTLTATGINLKWYTVPSGGSPLASAPAITTGSASSTIYYVSQTSDVSVGGCEGNRSAITVNVNALPTAPTVTSPVNLCVGGPGATLTATGTNLKWYTSASGGTALASAPVITTASASTITYYVSQSLDASAGSCEGDRSAITVNVNALPVAPTVTSPINLCVGGPGTTLTATGSNLKWYTVPSGGSPLAAAPAITTGSASSTIYYVSQTSDVSVGGCEGDRSAITVNVNALPAAPTVTSPVNLCVGGPGTTLTATGTNLKWYTSASGGTALASAPTITTGSPSSVIYYVSQSLDASAGSCEGNRSAITVNVNALPAAPAVISPVNLCVGGPGTTLTATGTNLKWYTAASGGTALASAPVITTASASTVTFFVNQSLDASAGSCEGNRSAITVNVNALPAAPAVISPVNLCVGGPGTTLTATGTNLKWYTAASGGSPLATAPVITTGSASSTIFYVSQSLGASAGSCEGNRSAITANVNALPTAPTVTSPVNLCIGGPGATLTATGTNLKWYTAASGGSGIPLASAPTITTGSASSTIFYVSQSLDASAGSCEGNRSVITVNVNELPAAPAVISPVNLCVGGPGTTLTATGTNLKWYTAASGGTALASAPVITTASASTITYYVSQSLGASAGSCEGDRSAITVNVNALPVAPTVTSPINLCVGGPGTTLTATGINLKWYTSASGGTPLASAPTITTGSASSTIFYVSQTSDTSVGACEGNRSAITVNVNALPAAPTVTSPVNLCVGGPAATLTATGTNLKWYTAASGGTALASAPTITTGAASSVTYYVSQSLDPSAGSCEGNRSAITVNVNALPAAPAVISPVNLCVGGPAATLTATGTNLKWYTAASGGSPLASAPVITTASASTITYYVSQSLDASTGSCEGDRSAITVNVNPLPAAPTVTSLINLCVGGPGTTLTATGTNLKWYNVASGGTPLATAPVITTGSASSTIYYVSQSLDASAGSCEGARSAITVNVNALPAAPTVTSPINLCVGGPGTTLTATGINLKWYTSASGGSPLASAPTITTGSASSTIFYVSQTSDASVGACEGTRSAITVNVSAPAAPGVISPVNLCVGGPGTTLTATGINLKWYTVPSGGSPLASAPAITTGSASSTIYYVSQTSDVSVGGCEGNRSAITANVNALPTAPLVTSPVNLCVGGPGTTLIAFGTNLKWYTSASGGTALASAPVITTASASSATYFVSQSLSAAFGGCEGTDRASLTVNVNSLPLAPVVATPINLCIGTESTLTAVGANLKWYTVATGGVGVTTAPKITPTALGSAIYYVSSSLAASSGGCEGPRSAMTLNFQTPPTLVISPVGVPDFVYCDSRTVKLLGTSPTAVSYEWAYEGVTIPTATTDTLSAGKGGYYSLLVKNVFGCGRRDSVLVKPTPFPTPILSPTEVQMCDGTDIMLYSTPAAAGYTYQWFKDGLPLGISLSENKTPVSIAGNYQVIITDIYTCVKTTNFSTVSTYAPVPKPNVLRTGTILTLDKPYSKYQWYRNNKIIAGATLRSYTMVLDGAYHAQVWDKNGCENYSDTLQSKALSISGQNSNDLSIKIYPNPTNDLLYIESPINIKATVFDALGRKLLEAKNASRISLKSFADGMYILYITDDEGILMGTYKIRKTE